MLNLTQEEIDALKKHLAEDESLYKVAPELFDLFFEVGRVKTFGRHEVIMQPGVKAREVYVVIDGLVASTYLSGNKVVMHALATPGTLMLHGGSFFNRRPSFMQWEALVRTRLLCIPEAAVRRYMMESHEFALWMHGVSENNILSAEEKTYILADTAEQRYRKLATNLPRRVFKELSSRVMASYLGITEQSLSRIKRIVIQEDRERERAVAEARGEEY